MTTLALKKKKQELLASQVSNLVSDTNENLLRVNLSKFFTDLEQDIQSALMEYWNDTVLLQGQLNLILAPIHEKHQEYYELIMKHKLQEFNRGKRTGERLVRRQQGQSLKASKPVKFHHSPEELFGTLQYSEDKLSKDTFTASEFTLNRIDESINQILVDGYREGNGINDVSRKLTERFDQLRTWEATRIARTEIHTAQNMGVMNSYESLGVEYTQWKSAHDKRDRGNRKSDRANHIIMDGEIIPFGGTYSNGLKYPGDKSGKIEEWINCRCSNAPFVLPAGMMAPSFSPFREEDLIPITETSLIENTFGKDTFPDPVNEHIQTFHENTKTLDVENGWLINEKGEFIQKIDESTDPTRRLHGESYVTFSIDNNVQSQVLDGHKIYMLHNHPNNAFKVGKYSKAQVMFSPPDMMGSIVDTFQHVLNGRRIFSGIYVTSPSGSFLKLDVSNLKSDKNTLSKYKKAVENLQIADEKFQDKCRDLSQEFFEKEIKKIQKSDGTFDMKDLDKVYAKQRKFQLDYIKKEFKNHIKHNVEEFRKIGCELSGGYYK